MCVKPTHFRATTTKTDAMRPHVAQNSSSMLKMTVAVGDNECRVEFIIQHSRIYAPSCHHNESAQKN